jgi:hypothetical protein
MRFGLKKRRVVNNNKWGVNSCSTTGRVTVVVGTVICWEPIECIVCCVGRHVTGCLLMNIDPLHNEWEAWEEE